MKKKFMAGLLSVAMLFTSVNPIAYGAELQKSGNYDTFATAYNLNANTPVTHALEDEEDLNNYKFKFTSDGVLSFSFKKVVPDADCGWGWYIEILDENGSLIYSKSKIKANTEFGKLPFKKNSEIYLRVKNDYSVSWTKGAQYTLTANYDTPKNWEAEGNDTMATAQNMSINTAYHGDLHLASDKDCYKLVMPMDGVLSYNFKPQYPDDNVGWGWDIIFKDEDGNEYKNLSKVKTNTSTGKMAFAKGTVLYAEVRSDYEISAPLFTEYVFTANVEKTDSKWETEYNNTRATAEKLAFAKTVNGTMLTSGDEDYYKLDVSGTGDVVVTLASSLENNPDNLGWGWDVVLCDNSGNEVPNAKLTKLKTKDSFSVGVKKGTYYIKVCANYSSSAPIDALYELTADFLTKVPEKDIKVPTIKKRDITVKWKALKKISGYQLRWSTKKNMKGATKKSVASSKTSYTIKNLKAKTTYYIQIRAYKKVPSGKTIYGDWSSKKKVKTKK